MKNRLLPLFIVLGCYSAYSQVGVGTKTPHASAQLEVTASDKGILIPNIPLTNLTDEKTIKNPKASLLVFNTTTNSVLTPGYYYWFDNRWNRLAAAGESGSGTANNGKDGMVGGDGAPGTPGADGISKDSTIYVDNTTGTIYILTPGTDPLDPKNWVPINGKDGLDGKNGIAGGQGLPGAAGLDGTIEMYIDQSTGIVYVKDPSNPGNWVPLNGPSGNNGKDGMIGGAGAPGTPGAAGISKDSTIYVDNSTGMVYILTPGTDPLDPKNWVPLNGKDGNNGKDGIAGGDGAPGTPGADGISKDSTIYVDNSTGMVYILTPGTDPLDPKNWVPLNGKDGKDFTYSDFTPDQLAGLKGATGADGKDFKYSDFTPDQLAGLKGATGADGKDFKYTDFTPAQLAGLTGATGAQGIAGANGATGADGKSAFEIWKELPGNAGKSTTDYINSLKGATGAQGIAGAIGATGAAGKDGIGGKTIAGTNITITGAGTEASPYVVNAAAAVVQQAIDEFTATAGQTSFTLAATPSSLSKVKLFINGVRIDNDAITFSGNTVTYKPANNGAYALMANDNIIIDYMK